MNILFLIGKYPSYGGTEKITTVLANYFIEKNNVYIVSFEQPVPELASELHNNIKLYYLSLPVLSIQNVKTMQSIIIDERIDLIINQWCLPFYTTMLCNIAIGRSQNCKLVSVLHGVPDKSKKVIVAEDLVLKQTGLLHKYLAKAKLYLVNQVIKNSVKYVYKHSDCYVVLSKGFIKSFQAYTGIKNTSKLYSIGNPITIPTEYDSSILLHKKRQILYVGRLDFENKRVNRIVEAWESIFTIYSDWELVLVGDGPHRMQLETYVKEHAIERVRFEGFVKEEPIQYYKDASILMLTSDLEGFGLVIVEGMSYGVVPLVYGSYVSVYDIIDHGKNGYITSCPYSKEQTIDYLKKLIDDEKLRLSMAEQAQKKSKKFTLESVTEQWENLFLSI